VDVQIRPVEGPEDAEARRELEDELAGLLAAEARVATNAKHVIALKAMQLQAQATDHNGHRA
jgi:hypothetical protein